MKRILVGLLLIDSVLTAHAQISAPGYAVKQLVKPSPFHGVHGLAFDAQDRLYAGSVVGQSVYRVDTVTGKVETIVGAPDGMADDLVFLSDGTMVWTSILQNAVRARKGNGPVRVLAENLASVNSINVRKSDGRLFVAQVFGGDGLWALDPTGKTPPRNILKDIGGLNGFDIGPDGWIYGPLWFKKQVVKINPDNGEMKVVADGFHTPAAANFDSKWNLYVLDTALGTVNHVDIKTGAKKVVAQLETSLDNLAIDSKDRMFVTNMADNGIQEVNVQNGRPRPVIKGELATPVSIAAVAEGKHDVIYVADIFALRAVDGNTGRVTDIERSHAANVHIGYPTFVSADVKHVYVVGDGVLQFDRQGKFVKEWKGVRASAVVPMRDGALLTVQGDALVRVDTQGAQSKLATELGGVQAVALQNDHAFFVDQKGGRLLRVMLANGSKQVVASGLQLPHGIALDRNGHVLTIEFAKRRLVSIDPANGKIAEVATNLPVGMHGPRPEPGAGLAVGATGAIYISSDVENSLYQLTKQ